MRIICSDVDIFKNSFGAISKIVDVVQMELDSDGLRVDAIDSSHVTFVHLDISKSEFDVFECDKPRKIHFSTEEFLTYIKRIGKDSLLELDVDDLYLTVRAEGKTTKTFKMKLLDMDDPVPSLPEIDYPLYIEISTKLFKEICMDIIEFSQKIKLYNEGNVVKFKAYGDFVDAEVEYVSGNELSGNYVSYYDISKIKEMMKADKFATKTKLFYGNDMPILIEMKSDDEKQNLSFILAPRIEEEY